MYKLLIADDEALEREALIFFIRKSNLEIGEIIECNNGKDATKKIILEKPDIALLDINMPGLSGLEVLERVKVSNHCCKVIFSTAFNYFEYVLKALQLGAIDFIVKPAKKDYLINILRKAIDQLDEEYAEETYHKKMKDIVGFLGNHIIGNLVTGNLNEEVFYYLGVIGISDECSGNCFCIRLLKQMIREEEEKIMEDIKQELALLGLKVIINIQDNMMTLVVFELEDSHPEKVDVTAKIVRFLFEKRKMKVLLGVGMPFDEICEIEQSFYYAQTMVGDVKEEFDCKRKQIIKNQVEHSKDIQKICNYIKENYSKKISLDDIGEFVGFSKYYVCRLFKQHIGSTIIDYLTEVRFAKAKELLKKETYSIKQISGMVGYQDPNYFTWTFKKREGISPLKYRYTKE